MLRNKLNIAIINNIVRWSYKVLSFSCYYLAVSLIIYFTVPKVIFIFLVPQVIMIINLLFSLDKYEVDKFNFPIVLKYLTGYFFLEQAIDSQTGSKPVKISTLFILNLLLKRPYRLSMRNPNFRISERPYVIFAAENQVYLKEINCNVPLEKTGFVVLDDSKPNSQRFFIHLNINELEFYLSKEAMKNNPAGLILGKINDMASY